MTALLISRVAVLDAPHLTDVLIRDGVVVEVGAGLAAPNGAQRLDGSGGTLLPGLWDHHIHLIALAAWLDSVRVGPPDVTDRAGLSDRLMSAEPGVGDDGWIRAVGYHESVAGPLDAATLDRLGPDHPVRVQHRSGALWVVNRAGADRLGLDTVEHPGIERDGRGRPTGRLLGADAWLRDRLGSPAPPDLARVGALLAAHGVTGVTDLTPSETLADLDPLAEATADGALPQRVMVTGGPALATLSFPATLRPGPVKLWLADHRLPDLGDLVDWIARAHDADRAVAIHSVTRASLVLALAALDDAGAHRGDRIEHGSVIPSELIGDLAARGLTVVTQPNFVAERGDQYLTDVEPDDVPHLYRCRSLADAGVRVAGGTDAPFGDADPWKAMRAATDRTTAAGRSLGAGEALGARRSLELFLGWPDAPAGPARTVRPGAAADLCLVDGPPLDLLTRTDSPRVRATVIDGRIVVAS